MIQNGLPNPVPLLADGEPEPIVTDMERKDEPQPSPDRKYHYGQAIYWSFVALAAVIIVTIQPVFAAGDFWDAFSTIMKDIYGKLLGISTIVAVTAATVALLIRMISRNQRAVDEASSWLKRILVTWIILNTLGFIIAYLQPLIVGGQYNA